AFYESRSPGFAPRGGDRLALLSKRNWPRIWDSKVFTGATRAFPALGLSMSGGMELNATPDPALQNWVGSARRPGTDVPLPNLPSGVFRRAGSQESLRGGVAIGDQVLDLRALHELRVLSGSVGDALAACTGPTLNPFMALGCEAWSALRAALSRLLSKDAREAATLRGML